ncbi:cob(I)yrinic acid a,c-diamide adenosyltransferase [Prochlorococcus sp. MIT 1300]|uniref:cob(I)yrinic acid a,c-diamide adenosyltransferase n=1 Tax=Prochlorococcus sp. MIT 1300 TaxID=3096218 RepID=UPI002A74B086|nr:cob(I)yrinic acid a,c-diamide adenosyltransferase [Prochlorococcus sp. MIT 1300]
MKLDHSKAKDQFDIDQVAEQLGLGGNLSPEKDQAGYQLRMQRRKEVQQKRLDQRTLEKGLILVFTGNGKGKTTAALGLTLRMLGHNERVAIVQFIKGGWEPGEARALKAFGEQIDWHALGEGFTWETQNRDRDKLFVKKAWEQSLFYLKSKDHKLVVLDEINVAIKLGYLDLTEVIKGLSFRPDLTHVVLTGRGAPKELIEKADLVTEMNLVHHPFKEKGIKAQAGIEF